MMVLLSHAAELADGNRHREVLTRIFHTISFGELGVDFFFILSGYLITASWLGTPDPIEFLSKRVLRIYPGFIAASLISVLLVGALGAADPVAYWHELQPAHLATQLVFLFDPRTPETFGSLHYNVVNGALWTIHYEFLCYLVVLALGTLGLLRNRRLVVALWCVGFVAFAAFRFYRLGDPRTGAIEGGFVTTMLRLLPMFLSGMALYVTQLVQRRSWPMLLGAAVVLVAGLSYRGTAELAVCSAGAYLMLALGLMPIRANWLRAMPDISYGVYLYGWPCAMAALYLGWAEDPWAVFAVSTATTVAAGYISFVLVERPCLRRRPRFNAKRLFGSASTQAG